MSAKWTFWAWEVDIKTAPKKLALLQLANNADDDGKSWYAIAKMANACGVAERTFQRQIQSLENDGLLQVDRRNNRSSIYHLQDEMLITLKNEGDTLTSGGDRVTGQGDSVTDSGVSESRTILTIDTNTTPNNIYNPVAVAPVEQKKRFVVPLQGDVLNYMMERKLTYSNANHESEKFCDFYESKNWMVGKTKMKQWKASVRNWLRNNNQYPVNNITQSKPGWSAGTFDPNFLES